MSNSIIEVNYLSKSYTISHEGRERYTAFRDVMAQKARNVSVMLEVRSISVFVMLNPIAIGRSISSKLLNTPCHIQ